MSPSNATPVAELPSASHDDLLHGFQIMPREAHYSRLGIEVLFQGRQRTGHWDISTQWLLLLGQFLPLSNTVLMAVACFGSVCEAMLIPAVAKQAFSLLALRQKALASLRKEVSTLPDGPIPVFLTSIVLAAADVLLRRLPTALMHTRGAFGILTLEAGQQDSFQAAPGQSLDLAIAADYRTTLHDIALAMDMHTAWYRLSEPPDLPANFGLSKPFTQVNDVMGSTEMMNSFLHDCYHFASRASRFKYCLPADIPPTLVDEQSQYISVLTQWLRQYDSAKPQSNATPYTISDQVLILKAQCLSTMIYISTILQPFEITYDSYTKDFISLLDTCEILLHDRQYLSSDSSLPHFQMQPGIFQPLYFTALKCRHSFHRRRAIDLFSQLGIEGPWNAKSMAAVASRAISIEEGAHEYRDFDQQDTFIVSEKERVHGCGLDFPELDTSEFPTVVHVTFSLCNGVENMLKEGNIEEAHHWTMLDEHIQIQDYI